MSPLARARRGLGLTQAQVAERMGTTQSAVSDLENGKVDPTVRTLGRYAEALGGRLVLRVELPPPEDTIQ